MIDNTVRKTSAKTMINVERTSVPKELPEFCMKNRIKAREAIISN
jgi:hypothetical protein